MKSVSGHKASSRLKATNPSNIKRFSLKSALLICLSLIFATNTRAAEPANFEEATLSDALISHVTSSAISPVIVTAADLVTKVYGAIDLPATKNETMIHTGKQLNLLPEADGADLWLDSDAGYAISYSGMTPQVSAVAQFDNDSLSSFGYFFIFPYTPGCRDAANRSQCDFCSSLLQEMYDMGSIVGIPADTPENTTPDPLFAALGSYDGNHINVSLTEQTQPDQSGRFLLVLEVTPNAYNLYDAVMALSE